MQQMTITELAAARIAAKQREDEAIAERRRIDSAISELITGPSEGSVTNKDDGFKVTVTRKLTRKVDTAKLQAAWTTLSDTVQKTFTWSAGLDTKHFRALQDVGNADLATASEFITTSPAAVSVSVEAISKE